MYSISVRCGNLIASQKQSNPMFFWWGMKKVSSVGNHNKGNLEDFWRTNTLPMPTGLAPPKHHGVFFWPDRQGAIADGLHGLNPRNTDNKRHPLVCRPALIERLVKDWVQRWKQGPIYKRINPSWALGLSSLNKSRRVKCKRKMEQSGVYPPLENLCL
jgi:hypothetical protein